MITPGGLAPPAVLHLINPDSNPLELPRRDWRRLFWLPGSVTVAAFLGNELLMVAAMLSQPMLWMVLYFPVKAVGIPLCALLETMSLARAALRDRSRRSLVRLIGVVVIGAILWFNFRYDPIRTLKLLGTIN